MTQIQFVGMSPADLVAELEASLLPKLKAQLSAEFQPKEPAEYLTKNEACDLLRVSLSTLWRWKNKGSFSAYGAEGKVLFKRTELDEFVNGSLLK